MEAHKEGLKKESSPMDFITVIEDKVAWATQFKETSIYTAKLSVIEMLLKKICTESEIALIAVQS